MHTLKYSIIVIVKQVGMFNKMKDVLIREDSSHTTPQKISNLEWSIIVLINYAPVYVKWDGVCLRLKQC